MMILVSLFLDDRLGIGYGTLMIYFSIFLIACVLVLVIIISIIHGLM